MRLLQKKLVAIGTSRGIILPAEFIREQKPQNGYFIVYVPDEHERKQIRA